MRYMEYGGDREWIRHAKARVRRFATDGRCPTWELIGWRTLFKIYRTFISTNARKKGQKKGTTRVMVCREFSFLAKKCPPRRHIPTWRQCFGEEICFRDANRVAQLVGAVRFGSISADYRGHWNAKCHVFGTTVCAILNAQLVLYLGHAYNKL